MLEHRTELEALGACAIAIGFSPPAPLAALADHLTWPWPFLSDPQRVLYQRLRTRRGRLRDVYSVGTLRHYLAAARRGAPISRPVEDTRQLGADAVVLGGRAVWVHRSRTPDDRLPTTALLDAVRTARTGTARYAR